MTGHLMKRVILKDKESAFLDGYNSVKPLSEIESEFKNQKVRAALRFWASRLDDLHFPRTGSLVHFHNQKDFKISSNLD